MEKKIKILSGALLTLAILIAIIIGYFGISLSPGKQLRMIGIVNPNAGMKNTTLGFIKGMSAQGYVEGKNINYIIHESKDGIDEALREMVSLNVDLIFTVTTPATRQAGEAVKGTGIPVLFTMYDPVESGIINSLARPGGNRTGIQIRGSVSKALDWLLLISPGIKNIFVPLKYDTKATYQSLADLREIADSLNIHLTIAEVNSTTELESALAAMPDDIDAIFVVCSILMYGNIKKITDRAIAAGVPVASGTALYEEGVTITFGHSSFNLGEQAARMAKRILHGESPAQTPAEIADFFLGVNLKTAQKSGVEISNEILQQADFIVR